MKWISVNDKLPEKQGNYLVYTEEDGVFSAEYNPKRERSPWTDDYEGYCDLDVTYWMPLPEPPRTDRNDAKLRRTVETKLSDEAGEEN